RGLLAELVLSSVLEPMGVLTDFLPNRHAFLICHYLLGVVHFYFAPLNIPQFVNDGLYCRNWLDFCYCIQGVPPWRLFLSQLISYSYCIGKFTYLPGWGRSHNGLLR